MAATFDLPVAGLAGPLHALVTGASGGIGAALVAQLIDHEAVACVHAVARRASRDPALDALSGRAGERLQRIDADVTDAADRAALVAAVCARSPALQLVVQATGMLHAPGLRPERSVRDLDGDALARVFALNAFAPVLLARDLLPLLPRDGPAVLAALSARVGSIGDNRLGGWYAYRASKAALNQLMRTLAIELGRTHPQACSVLLHPGTVDSGLSQPFLARIPRERVFTPPRAAAQLLAVLARLTPADSGRFIAWDGTDIPW